MIKSYIQNRQKALMVSVLAFAFMFTASAAYAALTFGALATTSDGAYTLTAVDDTLLTLTSGTDAEDFTVSVTGATDSSLILASSGTGADAMQITTTAGGLDISVTGTAAGEDLDISAVGAATEMRLVSASTENDAIRLNASAGGIDIDATTGTLTITNLSTGAADDMTLALTGATDSSLHLSSTGTGADALTLTTTAGGLDISVTGTAAGEDLDVIAVGATTELRLTSASTEADAIDVLATGTAGGIDVDTTDGAITISAVGATNGDLTITVGDDFTLTGASGSIMLLGNATAGIRWFEDTETVTSVQALDINESGKTFYISTTGADYTLPAVATANGVVYRFVVAAAFSTDARVISTETDIIEGAVIANGAVVDCDAVDSITFEDGVENLGDFVEIRSNGTKWFINGSNGFAASSITCNEI